MAILFGTPPPYFTHCSLPFCFLPTTLDAIIQANLAALREADRLQRVAAAAEKSEKLKSAAEAAKQKHACLLMYRAEEESREWNEAWRAEEGARPEEPVDLSPKAKTGRVRVIRDKDGNPIDIRM